MRIPEKYQLPIFLLFVFALVSMRAISRVDYSSFIFSQLILSGTIFTAFYLRNKNKQFLLASAITLSLIPFCPLIDLIPFMSLLSISVIQWIVIIIAILCYSTRFWNKSNKWSILELLKLMAVIQFAIVYSIDMTGYGKISIVILGLVFISTRSAQQENLTTMTRNIITGILTLLCIFFILMTSIKASESDKQSILANMNYNDAREQKVSMNLRIDELELKLDSMQKQLVKCQTGE